MKSSPIRTLFFAILSLALLLPAAAQSLHGKIGDRRFKTFLIDTQITDEGSYQLQYSDSLSVSNWVTLTNYNSFPGVNTFTNNYLQPQRFYRVLRSTVPPAITLQPIGVTNYSGATVTLSSSATGSWPLRYQWYKDGQLVSGATSNVLSFTSTAASSGAYTMLVSNPWGNAVTPPASVLISNPVLTNIAGKKIHFEIKAAEGDYLTSGSFDATFNFSSPNYYYYSFQSSTSVYLNDSGDWGYQIFDANTGVIYLGNSITYGSGSIALVFQTATTGTFTLTTSTRNGSQTGIFTVL